MKTKISSIVIATTAVVIGYIISHPLVFHICNDIYQFKGNTGCLDDTVQSVGIPLLIFSLWVLFITILVFFMTDQVFRSWIILSVFLIPICGLFIVSTPISSHAFMDLYPFYRDDAARLSGEIFAAVSLIIIIWKYFANRRHGHV